MSKYTLANDLAILATGRRPEWVTQPIVEGMPTTAAAGVALGDAVRTLVRIRLRRDIARRRAVLRITTVDLTATYTVTIGGHAVTYDADAESAADVGDILDGIIAAIEDDTDTDALVLATVDTDDDDAIQLLGVGEDDYAIDFSADGTAVVEVSAEATSCTARMYALPRDGTDGGVVAWDYISGAEYDATARNWIEAFETAGLERLYVELDDLAGHASDGADVALDLSVVRVGPCVIE